MVGNKTVLINILMRSSVIITFTFPTLELTTEKVAERTETSPTIEKCFVVEFCDKERDRFDLTVKSKTNTSVRVTFVLL